MVRFIIYFLLVIIIFLSGIVIGISKDEEEQIVEEDMIEEVEEEATVYISEDGEKHLITQRFAHFLENIMTQIYELIVFLMYKFAKLFTG